MNPSLIAALAPAFAAGFALQRLLEVVDPLLNRIIGEENKKIIVGLVSLFIGLLLASALDLRVLTNLGVVLTGPTAYLDYLVTALIVSAGTEGFNSILKFLSYQKEETKAAAVIERFKVRTAVAGRPLSALGLEGLLEKDSALSLAAATFTPGAALNVAYQSVIATTGSTEPVEPLATLTKYNAVAQDMPAIRERILTDAGFGLPFHDRTMNANALKDLSPGWTLQKLADIVFDESNPLAA